MADTLHFVTGTPIANTSRTRDQQSPSSGLKGGLLFQRQRKFADDMAHSAVLAEQDEFIDAFFPAPNNLTGRIPRPPRNPFASLSKAKNMKEIDVRAAFVSGGYGAQFYIDVLISEM